MLQRINCMLFHIATVSYKFQNYALLNTNFIQLQEPKPISPSAGTFLTFQVTVIIWLNKLHQDKRAE